MSGTVTQIKDAVRVRLTPAQINILNPGLQQLVQSYKEHQKKGMPGIH
jgi:hypothetical protein